MAATCYLPEHMGTATLSPSGPFVAGSYVSLVLTYTAGKFGIDDSGDLKVVWRGTSDMGKPQFTDPSGAIAAGAVVVTIPILIMVLIFQRRIVSGLTAGAVKG